MHEGLYNPAYPNGERFSKLLLYNMPICEELPSVALLFYPLRLSIKGWIVYFKKFINPSFFFSINSMISLATNALVFIA